MCIFVYECIIPVWSVYGGWGLGYILGQNKTRDRQGADILTRSYDSLHLQLIYVSRVNAVKNNVKMQRSPIFALYLK